MPGVLCVPSALFIPAGSGQVSGVLARPACSLSASPVQADISAYKLKCLEAAGRDSSDMTLERTVGKRRSASETKNGRDKAVHCQRGVLTEARQWLRVMLVMYRIYLYR